MCTIALPCRPLVSSFVQLYVRLIDSTLLVAYNVPEVLLLHRCGRFSDGWLNSSSFSVHCVSDLLRWAGTREVEMSQDVLLNVKQVAQYLQLKESTIYSWAQDNKIPAIKIGRTWRFRRVDLDAWLEKHLQQESELDFAED